MKIGCQVLVVVGVAKVVRIVNNLCPTNDR